MCARMVMEAISVSVLEQVQREGKRLQAALLPPSAKALEQDAVQQESGFQHYRESLKLQGFPVTNKCTLTV